MQPDAKRPQLTQLQDIVATIDHDLGIVYAYVDEAAYLVGEKRYDEADSEIRKARRILRDLIK